jgi:hypothetical protein
MWQLPDFDVAVGRFLMWQLADFNMAVGKKNSM